MDSEEHACPICGQSVETVVRRHKTLGTWVPRWVAGPCRNPKCEGFVVEGAEEEAQEHHPHYHHRRHLHRERLAELGSHAEPERGEGPDRAAEPGRREEPEEPAASNS